MVSWWEEPATAALVQRYLAGDVRAKLAGG